MFVKEPSKGERGGVWYCNHSTKEYTRRMANTSNTQLKMGKKTIDFSICLQRQLTRVHPLLIS